MGSLPISQCPCCPKEEGREQHGDPGHLSGRALRLCRGRAVAGMQRPGQDSLAPTVAVAAAWPRGVQGSLRQ